VLGVLPAGSGNGFAREFKFRPIIRSLLNDIDNGEYTSIDAIEINGNLCLNVAGIGLDSFVAHSFNKLKLRGFLPYVVLTVKTFLQLRPTPVTIVSKGETLMSEDIFVLTIANTRQFGNNAFIAPHALPDDGMMDLVIIRPFPKIIAIVFIYRLFTGNMKESKYVRHIRTSGELFIKTDESRFHIDGEPFRISGEVSVRIRPRVLKVLQTARYRKFRAQQMTGS
jgi:diacylglycerol kinase family enzyme